MGRIKLSDHFTLEELTFSQTARRKGIDNNPSIEVVAHLMRLAYCMEQVRALLGGPIRITSGYRSPALNAAVGGAKNSAHMSGYAADFVCPSFGSPLEIVKAIAASGISFDQCIQEGAWVHASFDPGMRQEVLTAHFHQGEAYYSEGV